MIRVMVADDHPLVRRGLINLLGQHPDIAVVGEAASTVDMVSAVQATEPDVLLLDVNMPGPGFVEVLAELREAIPRVRTLVVSGYGESIYARRALQAGAYGYISKERAEEELVTALRVVARNRRYVGPELADQFAAEAAGAVPRADHTALSPREFDVLISLAMGYTQSQIAADLGLSVKTVSTHRTNLLEKMRMSTNAELVQYARMHDLLPRVP